MDGQNLKNNVEELNYPISRLTMKQQLELDMEQQTGSIEEKE